MIKIIKTLVITAYCLSVSHLASAKNNKIEIIDKVVSAYGGKSFLQLKSLNIKDAYKSFRYGQSESPTAVDMVSYRSDSSIDFIGKRKNFKWIRGDKDGFSIQHQVFDGKSGYQLNHDLKTLSINPNLGYAGADRRHFYYSDIALAVLLNKNIADAKVIAEDVTFDATLVRILLTMQGYEELTLYINKKTGLIVKMSKADWQPGKWFVYNYFAVKQQQGISFASSTYVTRGGQPYMVSTARELIVNPDLRQAFDLPKNYQDSAETLAFTEMMTKRLSDNIYLAGQDWGFSVFLDVGEYFIGTGGYEDLKQRFAAVQELAGKNKPLKYQVVSHHHIDHLEGMKEANELGVNFISVKEHQARIKELAYADIASARFEVVEGKASFADGALQVFDFANGHATHNLVSYFPEAKLLFTADMFFSRKVRGSPTGGETLKLLSKRLLAEKYDVELFAAAHSGRVLTAKDFNYALNHEVKSSCPQAWQICQSFNQD